MKKTETLRQLAAATNENHLDTLSRQIGALHQSRITSAEELASILEPLAQAMAALTDETRTTLTAISSEGRQHNEQLMQQALNAAKACHSAADRAENTLNRLNVAGRRLELGHYLLALVTGCVTAVLVSAFWLWLRPPTVLNQLDAQAVAEYLRPAIAPAKPSKGK